MPIPLSALSRIRRRGHFLLSSRKPKYSMWLLTSASPQTCLEPSPSRRRNSLRTTTTRPVPFPATSTTLLRLPCMGYNSPPLTSGCTSPSVSERASRARPKHKLRPRPKQPQGITKLTTKACRCHLQHRRQAHSWRLTSTCRSHNKSSHSRRL